MLSCRRSKRRCRGVSRTDGLRGRKDDSPLRMEELGARQDALGSLVTTFPSPFNRHHVHSASTPDAFGLRSELYEIDQTVYTQFNRDESLQYDP